MSGSASADRPAAMTRHIPDWAIAGRYFLLATLPYVLRLTSRLFVFLGIISPSTHFSSLQSAALIGTLTLLILFATVPVDKLGIGWRALLLGVVLNLGLTLATYTLEYQTLGIYFIVLSLFHWSEYMTQALFNPETTVVDNFMLYHSNAYVMAFFLALVEFGSEYYLWPHMKEPTIVTNAGITLVVFGECLRKASMWTAKSNFNHYVQFDKHEEHELVTHGVYALFR